MRRLRDRMCALALIIASLAPGPGAAGTPDFIPNPSNAFEDFEALEQPRADLPVGALWVQGFGPYGPGAALENIETVRSLSGFALNREMQLRLTLGIASLLKLDPGYRSRVSARFSELSIVRVKDASKLEGPAGEPRVYEALKAGTITITTDSDLSADLDGSISSAGVPILGRGDNGRVRSFTIDGKDMFIAFRVVTSKQVRSQPDVARLRPIGQSLGAVIHGHEIHLDAAGLNQCLCAAADLEAAKQCEVEKQLAAKIRKAGSAADGEWQNAGGGNPIAAPLRVPVADGQGGLYTGLGLTREFQIVPASEGQGRTCSFKLGEKSRIIATLEGTRSEPLKKPKSAGW